MKMIAYAVGIQPVDDKYYAFIPDFMKTASMGRFHSKCGIYLFTQAFS